MASTNDGQEHTKETDVTVTIYERLQVFIDNFEETYGNTPLAPAEMLRLCMSMSVAVASALILFHQRHQDTEKTEAEWAALISEELGLDDAYLTSILNPTTEARDVT